MKNLLLCSVVLISIGFIQACDDNINDNNVSGVVINAFTKTPLSEATVSILENGPSVVTDANGAFKFDKAELTHVEEIDNQGTRQIAVSISHPDYHPRETNMALGESTQLELSPKDVPVYFYNQPVQLNDGIKTGTLKDANMDRQLIQKVMDRIIQSEYKEVHSVLVYKNDKLILEEYFFGNHDTIQFENDIKVDHSPAPIQWTRKEKHYIASVNKALTSSVIGIALDKHNVTTDEKISKYLPDYASYFSNVKKDEVTISNCVNMQAGFVWDEWSSNDLSLLWKSDNFVDYVLSKENKGKAFEWRYNSALPNLMLHAVENITGQDPRAFALENFYNKLGIEDFDWQFQPDGYPEGAARMFMRSRDMLKVGITYLDNGVWNGEQVVPASWVDKCFNTTVDSKGSGDYSHHFWQRELDGIKYLSADGDGGNYINIFPEQDMVIVFTQGLYLKWPSYVNQADDIMKNYIFKALR